MVSFENSSVLILLTLSTSLLLAMSIVGAATAAAPAALPVAPSPTPAPLNLTHILEKGSQYITFMRLLKETNVGPQIASLVDTNSNGDGLTLLAPTDNAFNSLKPGALNKLTLKDQSELVLYHVLPKYYSFVTFETTSNPVSTQASSEDGVCTMNITSTSNQVNISTGIVDTSVTNALYSEFPLAVYSVDKVLLPSDLFGPNAHKHISPPAPMAGKPKNGSADVSAADAPKAEADTTTSGVGYGGRMAGSGIFVVVMFMGFLNLL